jgi:hypothetical protein
MCLELGYKFHISIPDPQKDKAEKIETVGSNCGGFVSRVR